LFKKTGDIAGLFKYRLDRSRRFQRLFPRRLVERSDAAGADKRPLAVDDGVLQIRVLSGPVGGVVMAAEQDAMPAHL